VLILEGPNKNFFWGGGDKNSFVNMYKNAWSFSLYQPSLHHIFTHILLFSTPAFVYSKLLFCFKYARQFLQGLYIHPYTSLALWVTYYAILLTILCLKRTICTNTNSLEGQSLGDKKTLLWLLILADAYWC
jgi:uncharacterized integral membrane protein